MGNWDEETRFVGDFGFVASAGRGWRDEVGWSVGGRWRVGGGWRGVGG
jgi:hypothetical protein